MFSSSASLQFERFCSGQAGEAGTSYLETKIISPCFKQGAAQPPAAESSKVKSQQNKYCDKHRQTMLSFAILNGHCSTITTKCRILKGS